MEALHASFAIVGALAMLIGIGAAVCGTYLLTQSYHPFTKEGYFDHLKNAPLLAMAYLKQQSQRGRPDAPAEHETEPSTGERKPEKRNEVDRKMKELGLLAEMALVNKENRPLLLLGTDLVFIGFVLQVVGGVCTLVDVMWSHFAKCGQV
jgi:hypothetical protein